MDGCTMREQGWEGYQIEAYAETHIRGMQYI